MRIWWGRRLRKLVWYSLRRARWAYRRKARKRTIQAKEYTWTLPPVQPEPMTQEQRAALRQNFETLVAHHQPQPQGPQSSSRRRPYTKVGAFWIPTEILEQQTSVIVTQEIAEQQQRSATEQENESVYLQKYAEALTIKDLRTMRQDPEFRAELIHILTQEYQAAQQPAQKEQE